MVQYAKKLESGGFAVGSRIHQEYVSLSEGIFTDIDDFLDYVDYLFSPNDYEAQSEREEICAFIIDLKMPPGDRLVKNFPDLKLANNPALTGVALMNYLYDHFTNEVMSNSIHFFILSLFEGQATGEIPCQFLSKDADCTLNCETIRRALGH